jgi:hypothetical protein
VRVPVVFDLVVCSAGQMTGDQGPPATKRERKLEIQRIKAG